MLYMMKYKITNFEKKNSRINTINCFLTYQMKLSNPIYVALCLQPSAKNYHIFWFICFLALIFGSINQQGHQLLVGSVAALALTLMSLLKRVFWQIIHRPETLLLKKKNTVQVTLSIKVFVFVCQWFLSLASLIVRTTSSGQANKKVSNVRPCVPCYIIHHSDSGKKKTKKLQPSCIGK